MKHQHHIGMSDKIIKLILRELKESLKQNSC